jgi:hypothetical protein
MIALRAGREESLPNKVDAYLNQKVGIKCHATIMIFSSVIDIYFVRESFAVKGV